MNMDVMSAGNYSGNYTHTNTTKSTETASFADAMEERVAERKKEYGDETIRNAVMSANPSFTVTSYEEIMKDWEEQVKANLVKYGMTTAEAMLAADPQAGQKMWRIGNSSKLYTFDELIRYIEEEHKKLMGK